MERNISLSILLSGSLTNHMPICCNQHETQSKTQNDNRSAMTQIGGCKLNYVLPVKPLHRKKGTERQMRRMKKKNIYIYIYQRKVTVQTSISNTVAQSIIFKPDARLQKPKERGMAWVKSSH